MTRAYEVWPDLNGAKAISFPRANGTEHILFGADADPAFVASGAISAEQYYDTTRIIHQRIGGQAVLCGVYVSRQERGSRLGARLIDYFAEHAGRVSGEFNGTTMVHKPLFAALLNQRGFFPEDNDFLVAIPRGRDTTLGPDTPDVIIVKDAVKPEHRWRVKEKAGRNRFYRVVGEPGRGEKISGPAHLTHLHTRYKM